MVVAGLGIAAAAFLASLAGGTGARSGRFRTGRHLVVAVAMGAGLDQLAVGGDGDTVLGGILGESAGGRDQAIGDEGDHQTILTGTKLIQGGACEGHAEGGSGGEIVILEAELAAVEAAALRMVEFAHQLFPTPVVIDGQESGQSQAEGIEGAGAEGTPEAGGEVRPPGGGIEQEQDQVKGIHVGDFGIGIALRRLPVVAGAAAACLPGRRGTRGGQLERQQGADGLPAEGGSELGLQQTALGGGDIPGFGQLAARGALQLAEGTVQHLDGGEDRRGGDQHFLFHGRLR